MITARRLVQGGALALFLFLLLGSPRGWADLFFRFDPLTVGLSSLVLGAFGVSLILVGALLLLTLLHGRLFCGWLCPLGALHDAADLCSGIGPRLQRGRRLKLWLLLLLGALLAGGLALTWLLDPLTWASRILTVLATGSVREPAVVALLLGLFLAIALVAGRRGFCRLLCPLGALLGLLSRVALYRRARDPKRCTGCGRCEAGCRMAAFGAEGSFHHDECIHCYECEASCPAGALSVASSRALPSVSLDRRATLASLAGAAAIAGGLRLLPGGEARAAPPLRPPGSVPEARFLDLCVRCGACLRVCPSETLAPARLEAGLGGLETPILVPRRGGCLPGCNACGQSCPTSAIQPLALEPKRQARIGLARVDSRRCIASSQRRACLVCYAACPFEAIVLKLTASSEPWGDRIYVVAVNERKCTGCGLCEARCPVPGPAAIRVTRG